MRRWKQIFYSTVRSMIPSRATQYLCKSVLFVCVTCLEWDLGSGGLKKESGSFLILIGTDGGTAAPLGFITALKSASRSVSESPRTWTTWCPAGGLCWLGSMISNQEAKTQRKVYNKQLTSYLTEALKDASTARRNSEMHESERV